MHTAVLKSVLLPTSQLKLRKTNFSGSFLFVGISKRVVIDCNITSLLKGRILVSLPVLNEYDLASSINTKFLKHRIFLCLCVYVYLVYYFLCCIFIKKHNRSASTT